MREKEFDQYVRDQLGEYSSAVPDDMWQRIQGGKDDRRALVFWWWVGGAFFIGVCFVLVYFFGSGVRVAAPATAGVSAKVPATAGVRGFDTVIGKVGSVRSRVGEVGMDSVVVRRSGAAKSWEGAGNKGIVGHFGAGRGRVAGVTGESGTLEGQSGSRAGGTDAGARRSDARAGRSGERAGQSGARAGLPALAILKSRLSPKAPPLAIPKNVQKRNTVIAKGIHLDLSLSPLVPHIQNREGLSYAASLRAGIPIWKKFSFTPGLQYTRVSVKQYKDSGISPVHSADRITNIDLSALIGYTAEFKRFSLGINTGLIANLHSQPLGQFTYNNRYGYVTNTGLSLYLGFDLEKKLSPRWSLFVEPFYRQQLTKRFVVINEQLTDASGAFFGIRYNFKRGRQQK